MSAWSFKGAVQVAGFTAVKSLDGSSILLFASSRLKARILKPEPIPSVPLNVNVMVLLPAIRLDPVGIGSVNLSVLKGPPIPPPAISHGSVMVTVLLSKLTRVEPLTLTPALSAQLLLPAGVCTL